MTTIKRLPVDCLVKEISGKTSKANREKARQSFIREADKLEKQSKANRKREAELPVCCYCKSNKAVVRTSWGIMWSGYHCLNCNTDIATKYEMDEDGDLIKFTPAELLKNPNEAIIDGTYDDAY